MTGDIERLLAPCRPGRPLGGDAVIRVIGLGLAGRRDEARARLADVRQAARLPAFRAWTETLDGLARPAPRRHARRRRRRCAALKIMDDPEAIFQEGWLLCDVGEHEKGLEQLQRAVAKGYTVAPTLAGSRAFDALRGDPGFQQLLARGRSGPPAGAGRVPGERRRATARPLTEAALRSPTN